MNMTYSWTQPCCEDCWNINNPGVRNPVTLRPQYRETEICVYCGNKTGREGDPTAAFDEWVKDKKCDGKEPAHDLYQRLTDSHAWMEKEAKIESRHRRTTEIWWSLLDNVTWSFVEEDGSSHLQKMLNSMAESPVEFLR